MQLNVKPKSILILYIDVVSLNFLNSIESYKLSYKVFLLGEILNTTFSSAKLTIWFAQEFFIMCAGQEIVHIVEIQCAILYLYAMRYF